MTTMGQSADGARRRDDALALLEARRRTVLLRARRALLTVLLETGEASADHVRDAITLPDGMDPKCLGAVPSPLSRAGIIRADGFVRTSRAVAHVRPLTRWVLNDPVLARRWLAEHPDTPDLGESDDDELPLWRAASQK